MSKLLLISTVVAMIAIPVRAARAANAQKGLRSTVLQFLAFGLFYVVALRFLWGRF